MGYYQNKIDVIIPTLNGKKIHKTIESLNIGILKPKIIICIYYYKFDFQKIIKNFKNVLFVKSHIKNQVQQRILGYDYVDSNFILQLDDDIILDKKALLNLYKNKIILGEKSIVGPVFLDLDGKSIHNLETNTRFFSNIYKYLICDARYGDKKIGTITSLGVAYGVNIKTNKKIVKTQWLPGGCVLFSRNILKENYDTFKFKGKSYSEDVFFSLQREKKNFKHFTIINSKVYIDKSNKKFIFKDFMSEIKIRNFLLKYTKGNKHRFYLWVFLEFIKENILKKLLIK
jgi:glycosyltransferase involved in cell wall biosynthesis